MLIAVLGSTRGIATMPRTNLTISVTIRPDQKAWLKDHPAVNVSGLLQEAIDKIMMASRTDNYKF